MALAKSTMTILSPLLVHLTIPTSTTLRITGNTTRACFLKIARRVEEGLNYLMGRFLREIFIRTRFKEWANFTL